MKKYSGPPAGVSVSSVQLAAVDCDPPADASGFPFAVPSVATLRRIDTELADA